MANISTRQGSLQPPGGLYFEFPVSGFEFPVSTKNDKRLRIGVQMSRTRDDREYRRVEKCPSADALELISQLPSAQAG